MDFDSASMTPPSSPILGYSGSRYNESCAVSGLLYCFSCKGQVRSHDHSFSPDGYILRREVISAIKILDATSDSLNSNNFHQPRLHTFFGGKFDMTDIIQLKKLICFTRKNMAMLDHLNEPSFSYGISRTTLDIDDEPDPWRLRSDVCLFLNDVVSRMIYYKGKIFTDADIEDIFGGLRKSLTKVENWPVHLKSHCGSRDGNSCPSAEYHLFHLNLEIRWSLFIIYGMKSSILDWIFEDLLFLAWYKYSTDSGQTLIAKHPFNCFCVKEFWTMLRLVLDKLRPRENDFWDILLSSLTRFTSSTAKDVFFPIWLIVHLAPLSDYTLCGVYSPDAEKKETSNQNSVLSLNPACYGSVNQYLKDWSSKGGKVGEIMKLTSLLLPHWGSDITVVLTFFNHWLPKIDRAFEFSNFDGYKSSERWLSIIKKICAPFAKGQDFEDDDDPVSKNIASDSFLSFIRLVVGHVQLSTERNWRKLKSNICLKLDKKNVSKFSEVGLLRTTTLYLSLAFSSSDTLSLCERMADALKEHKNSPGRQKTVILASTTMYLLLLQKSVNITSISGDFIKTVNELMLQTVTDSIKKDLIMIYLDLLECLPSPVTPDFSGDNLGRASLISPNLTMWLLNCGSNYLIRTLRVLTKLTSWVLSSHNRTSEEKDELAVAIFDRTAHFLCQTASQNQNRIPSTDIEPLANLAANLTILSRLKNMREGFTKLFDNFAMYERTCPEVSQMYVSKLLGNDDFANNSYNSDVKWLQVWIRLIALGCSVPDELSDKVLGCGRRVSDNEQLLRLFCSKEDDFNKNDIQTILTPVVALIKSSVNGVFKDPIVVASIVKTCAILTKHLKFENVYLRGVQNSFLHEVLQHFFPPVQSPVPWDRPPSIVNPLKNHMLDYCTTIMSNGMFLQDNYLQRKVRDIVHFSFLGFSDRQGDNPGVKIMQYACETNSDYILKEIIPSFRPLIFPDLKSTMAERFLKEVILCGHSKLWQILLHSLPIVISIFVQQNTDSMNNCTMIVKHCCAMKDPNAKLLVKSAFDKEMEENFGFKNKRYFDLFDNLCRQKPPPHLLQFLKEDLVPIVEHQLMISEMKRGIGRDNSLRQPMERLKRDISELILQSTT